ncbi:hypothetical protein ACO0LG_17045 [Undibacterium sp. Ji42W]|uniref:hypothetical protein n=1 Tax=Undibacterium sp. Ji42W TaxID=3413039 RepID=UPI003BEF7BA0
MQEQALNKYIEQLENIKQRGKVFVAFTNGTVNAIYEDSTIEVATLQLRKILELLAFGFVLSIGEKAIPAYASFMKYKKADDFISNLNELSDQFYPVPINQPREQGKELLWEFPDPSEYLTSEDFITLFEHCDLILEPRKVGAIPLNLDHCKAANQRWYKKIVRLLNAHLVHEMDSKIAYLFQMESLDTTPTCTHFEFSSDSPEIKLTKKPNFPSTTVTLTDHLRRQLSYLRRSCELYDAGHLDEAIRIALVIRVLIHDTPNSASVLHQMGVKTNLKLVTSFGLSNRLPKNFSPTSIIPLFASSQGGGIAVPFTLPTPPILFTVDDWWNEEVWKQDSTLTRRKIILETANKEGGAHVQENAPKVIQELRKGLTQVSSVKVGGVEVGTPNNFHFVLNRQFAHELLNSAELLALIN